MTMTIKTASILKESLKKYGAEELLLEDVDNENIETVSLVANGFVFVFETDDFGDVSFYSYDIMRDGKGKLYADQGFNCLIQQDIVEEFPNIETLIKKIDEMINDA